MGTTPHAETVAVKCSFSQKLKHLCPCMGLCVIYLRSKLSKTRCMGRALYSCELRQITTPIVTNGISGNIENA